MMLRDQILLLTFVIECGIFSFVLRGIWKFKRDESTPGTQEFRETELRSMILLRNAEHAARNKWRAPVQEKAR